MANNRISHRTATVKGRTRTNDRSIRMIDKLRLGVSRIAVLCFTGMISLPAVTSATVINRGEEGPPLSEIRPAPKSIYPDQKMITAQPSPSEVDPAFLGPVLLMKSATVDLEAGTASPLAQAGCFY